jgi:hypothetical protein
MRTTRLSPAPTRAVGPTLNSMFTVLFRGNSSTLDTNPNRKDDALLTEFAHDLVQAQLEPLDRAVTTSAEEQDSRSIGRSTVCAGTIRCSRHPPPSGAGRSRR